jgi:hypothetical protein
LQKTKGHLKFRVSIGIEKTGRNIVLRRLTHSCNNLCLQAILIGETASKVADAPTSITSNVRHLSNVIEHVAASEQKNSDQADGSPDVAILNNWKNIRPGNAQKSNCSQNRSGDSNATNPIDWTVHRRMWSVGEMSRYPRMDLLSCLRTAGEIISYRT